MSDDDYGGSFLDLYTLLLYGLCLLVGGKLASALTRHIVPPLVGEIIVGIVFGPYVWDVLPNSVLRVLGEVGLVLLLCQAGINMEFDVLRKVGIRAAVMALCGSLLPSCIGFILAYTALNQPIEASIAIGCSFGPTSAGIAMNILGQTDGLLQSEIGQLIVAIAIVDDIIALVVLSQLQALTADSVSVLAIIIPILSALLWLGVGGAVALYVMPTVLNGIEERQIQCARPQNDQEIHQQQSQQFSHVIILLFLLLPATYYTQASFLMGAFLAGLCACSHDSVGEIYSEHLSDLIEWLMRCFFGATIAFEIPILLFNDASVIGNGFLLSLSLLGKVAIGPLLTPVPVGEKRWKSRHVRDCALVGCSMAGEAEFAFLVARFGFTEDLFSEQVYASVVFAILLSTIVSPVMLRLSISHYADLDHQEEGKKEGP